MYFFYILLCKDKTLYSGITNDLKKREKMHNEDQGSVYVKTHGGGKIIYSEKFQTKGKALRREAEVKKWPRVKKLTLLKRPK